MSYLSGSNQAPWRLRWLLIGTSEMWWRNAITLSVQIGSHCGYFFVSLESNLRNLFHKDSAFRGNLFLKTIGGKFISATSS